MRRGRLALVLLSAGCVPGRTNEVGTPMLRVKTDWSPVMRYLDSAVAAALVHKAIGHQLTCVYVDTGLMRANESDQVVETFQRNQGIELQHIRAADRFFERSKNT